jgi:hypothetical protein
MVVRVDGTAKASIKIIDYKLNGLCQEHPFGVWSPPLLRFVNQSKGWAKV